MDEVARGRGARSHGARGRGGRVDHSGRDGGRAGGRAGRGGRHGLPADSGESATPSVAIVSVTHTVSLAGEASLDASASVGMGAAPCGVWFAVGDLGARGKDEIEVQEVVRQAGRGWFSDKLYWVQVGLGLSSLHGCKWAQYKRFQVHLGFEVCLGDHVRISSVGLARSGFGPCVTFCVGIRGRIQFSEGEL
ncbi:unnamed protein product [Microthlaspi erraticum]|uniref:Uncharacterized protein n=1 Tax=Microthlaspi erraticum TaxID=1685480 RepID=A0A6D2KA87_9BRAS|nr:unnamed protein product [Microthlaspi erraticum]CAA7049083.1 unnamed protein product [Microthlaspi erraticum]